MLKKSLAILLALASPTLAETEISDKATGAVYVLGTPAGAEITLTNKLDGEMDSYILTEDCYAKHPIFGLGNWTLADGGWGIAFGGTATVSFDGDSPFPGEKCTQ